MKLPQAVAAAIALTSATITLAAPAQAQTYDPAYPVCLQVYRAASRTIISSATIEIWRNARCRHRDGRRSAWSIPITAGRSRSANVNRRMAGIEIA